MNGHSYSLELGTILRDLPFSYRTEGPIAAIRIAYAFGLADRLWSRRAAVRVAFRANYEPSQAHGKGNRAARRQFALLTAKRAREGLTFGEQTRRLQLERAASLAAEKYSEARVGRHTERQLAHNPHD